MDQDSLGRLWIGTANDINIWDGHEFYMYSDLFKGEKYLSSKNIRQLALYKNYCIVHNDAGLEIIDIKKQEIYPYEFLYGATCFDLYGNILYIGKESSILVVNLNTLEIQDSILTNTAGTILHAFDEMLYVYGLDGSRTIIDLKSRNKHTLTNCFLKKVKYKKNYIPVIVHTSKMKHDLPDYLHSKIHYFEVSSINDLRTFYVHNDKVWIAQDDELYLFQTETGRYLKVNKKDIIPEFSRLFVYDFFTDYKDNLYIMTNINGLYIYSKDNNKFTHIKHPNLSYNMVKSIHVLSDSTIVAGIYGKGIIFFYSNGGLKEFFKDEIDAIWDLETSFESNDEYFAVSSECIYSFYKTNFKSIARKLKGEVYYYLQKGFEKYFLYHTAGKNEYIIEELDKNFISIRKHYMNEHVVCLKQIKPDTLLVSSINGVYTLDLNTGKTHKIFHLRAQSIDLYNKHIYISTNDGLFILDYSLKIKDSITKKSHGISDNFIYYSAFNQDGSLWIAHNKGLSMMFPNSKKITNFNLNDGLQANEFNTNAYCNFNGTLYFGGVNGINIIPNKMRYPNSIKPRVYHTKILVDDEIKIEDDINKIILDYSNNTISLFLRHVNFTNREKTEYFHRLLPIEKNFVNTGNNNFIRYTNLPQGSYTLQYFVKNQYGIKSDTKFLTIRVLPPFWKTWWFYTLVLLSIFIMISGFIIYLYEKNRQKILLRYEVQKNLEIERMRISRDLHDNVGAQLSYLISQIEILTSKYTKIFNEADRKKFMKLENISREAIQTIRETIWLLNSKHLTIEQLIDKTKQYVLKIKEINEQIEVEYYENVISSTVIPPSTAINLFRIIQESITNSYKHSKCRRIKVYFENDQNVFHIRIDDDGVGFDMNTEFMDHYGLKNIKARADEINAEVVIRSEKQNGTSVEIKIGLQQMQYVS